MEGGDRESCWGGQFAEQGVRQSKERKKMSILLACKGRWRAKVTNRRLPERLRFWIDNLRRKRI